MVVANTHTHFNLSGGVGARRPRVAPKQNETEA